jgi:hypothetical protein
MNFPDKEQKIKTVQKFFNLKTDGVAGEKTWSAIANHLGINVDGLPVKQSIKNIQKILGLSDDGVDGSKTWAAILDSVFVANKPVEVSDHSKNKSFPKASNSSMLNFYGEIGENQVSIDLPYPMVLAWDTKKTVNKITCHKKCADTFKSFFQDLLKHYGIKEIERLGLNKFGGCLNVRKMRGGSEWSHHSWGCVIDIPPENNQLKWNKSEALLAKSEYKAFWDIVYSHGMTGLGPERDYDWMHFGCVNYRK